MWVVLDLDGETIFWSTSWDAAVRWAMKNGGELDILFQAYMSAPDE